MSSTVVSVLVVSIKKGKDKGNLSSFYPFHFTLQEESSSACLPWSRSLAPNEQRLEVGPIEVLFSVDAAEFLARFLHSNTTRSLHCLWQFIPQSVEETPWSGSLSLLWSQNHIYAVFLCHTCLSHLLGLGYPTFLMNLAFSHGQTPDLSVLLPFSSGSGTLGMWCLGYPMHGAYS